MENLYKEGTLVSVKENPAAKLLIRRYYKRVYYCLDQSNPSGKELVYFERELVSLPQNTELHF